MSMTNTDDFEDNDECATCGGTGEVTTSEQVYPGEPHMADIGTAPCPDCGIKDDDDYDPDEDY